MQMRVAIAATVLSFLLAPGQQAPATPSAPFDLTQRIPIVHLRINGQGPFAFVVDTGTNCDAIVSPRLAKQLGLDVTGRARITDLGGHTTRALDRVQLESLALAGLEFKNVQAVVTDLPDGDSVLDGILGFGLFRDRLLTLDYRKHRMFLEEGALAAGHRNVFPMRTPQGIPLMQIAIAGRTMDAGIDSGGLGLSIPEAVAASLPLASAIETAAYGRTQVSGFELSGAVLNGTVLLAGYELQRPWLEVNPVFQLANVGSNALRDFSITFDQRNKLVRFVAQGKLHTLAKPPNRSSGTRLDELVGTVVVTQAH